MKSIKEKAEENLEQNKDEIRCVYDRYAGFMDGANYVLDEVEYILENKELDCEEICDELIALIEQLKK